MFMGFEEFDGDYDIREKFPCPFCSEFFDLLGLCCHVDDEHRLEAKNGNTRTRLLLLPECRIIKVGKDGLVHMIEWIDGSKCHELLLMRVALVTSAGGRRASMCT